MAKNGKITTPLRVDKSIIQEQHPTKSLQPLRVPLKNLYHKVPKIQQQQQVAKSRILHLPLLLKSFNKTCPVEKHSTMISNVNVSWEKEEMWKQMYNEVIILTITNNMLCKNTGNPLTYSGIMKTKNKPIWKKGLLISLDV